MNDKGGFSFIEVVIALFVAGMMITSALLLMSSSSNTAIVLRDRFVRLLQMQAIIAQSRELRLDKPQEKMESKRTTTDPVTNLTYKRTNPTPNSALAKTKGVQIERVDAEWSAYRGPQQESLINLVYAPPEKEKS